MRYGVVLLFFCWGMALAADNLTDLLIKIEHSQRGAESYVAKMVMSSYEGNTKTGEATLELYVLGMELSIARYLTPATDRGKAFLQRKDQYWMYFPKTRQSVKISAKQRLFGEASIGDIVKPPLLSTYEVKRVSNTAAEDIFELTAKVSTAPYQRILLWWDRNGQRIVREDFYTRTGVLLKQARYLAHQQVKGYLFAVKVEIHDALQTNKRTILEVVDLREKALSDEIFYPEALDYLPYTYK
ncbi:hypothetical protein BREVNS_0445 [Brevinematales bacterium NS]|nr:outer membrane lipoprotein-sorting protein [Brevinematales bacterium]QJR21195.1 hypothetical protein BREVNS_0445 [Brevinematales bacterium NS]